MSTGINTPGYVSFTKIKGCCLVSDEMKGTLQTKGFKSEQVDKMERAPECNDVEIDQPTRKELEKMVNPFLVF